MSVKPKATSGYRDMYFDDLENLIDKVIVIKNKVKLFHAVTSIVISCISNGSKDGV